MRNRIPVLVSAVLLSGTAVARLPVVGLAEICRTNTLSEVGTAYAQAVYAAGAVPSMLPATTNAEVLAEQVARLDLLILCGGEDVDPARYGETDRGRTGAVNARRDAWEFALLDAAIRRKLPILGICRGCQVLNVRFGGTLWQDAPSEVDGASVHRLAGEHGLTVEPGSFVAKLLGGGTASVNSRHHQAVRRLAPGFRVTARAPDGVVEAYEGVAYPAVGVQFHPERLVVRQDRREFLPLFRGAFAPAAASERPARKRKVVAIPDYCPTNGCVAAKPNMAAALERAGFVPVVLPFTADDALLAEGLRDADALMVAGGIGALQDYDRRCDFEHRCIDLALRRGIPVAGVCHGSQVINLHFGGTLKLTPQMLGEADALVSHRMPVRTPYTDNFHLVDLEPGSRIAAVFGATRAIVNSSHSNRSLAMGRGLRVTARAPDGVVEAFEHETLPVMAFQFHPERLTFDPRQVELLRVSLSLREGLIPEVKNANRKD